MSNIDRTQTEAAALAGFKNAISHRSAADQTKMQERFTKKRANLIGRREKFQASVRAGLPRGANQS